MIFWGEIMKNRRFLRLYYKQAGIEKQLRELEDNNAYEVVYDYDEDGRRNGYYLVFRNKKINRKYLNLCKRLSRLLDKVSNF